MIKKIFLSTLISVGLTACATQTDTNRQNHWQSGGRPDNFSAEGRLSVKAEGRGSYANFDWQHQNDVQTISIKTPLGGTLGQLCKDPVQAVATDSNGKIYRAGSAAELSRDLLGFELPVQYLYIWLQGNRVADVPFGISADGKLQQFGWTVTQTANSEGTPKMLQLEGNSLTVRLVLDYFEKTGASDAERCSIGLERHEH